MKFSSLLIIAALVLPLNCLAAAQDKWLISRGTSAPLPRQSLVGVATEVGGGAETVLLDTVMSMDGELFVLTDTKLDDLTDVGLRFPTRSQTDGAFQVFDFTSEELGSLTLENQSGAAELTTYPLPRLQPLPLEDALALIRFMEQKHNRALKVILLLHKNWLHREHDKDLSKSAFDLLEKYGYASADYAAFMASYDHEELQRLKRDILPQASGRIGLIQFIEDNDGTEAMRFTRGSWAPYNYDWMFTKFGLKSLSSTIDAIGLPLQLIIDTNGNVSRPNYLEDARLLGLQVLALMPEQRPEDLPDFANTPEAFWEHILFFTGLDGVLTENESAVRNYLGKRRQAEEPDRHELKPIEQLLLNIKESRAAQPEPPSPDNPF